MTNLTNTNLNVNLTGWKVIGGKMVLVFSYGITAPAYKLREKYRTV
jgi:hypothetical protein